MSMSDKQVKNLLMGTLKTLLNIPAKQRDRVAAALDFKEQDGFCLRQLIFAVEVFSWDDFYEARAKREMEWQSERTTAKARELDRDRAMHLCRQEEYHA
jgi:hypothetical protein